MQLMWGLAPLMTAGGRELLCFRSQGRPRGGRGLTPAFPCAPPRPPPRSVWLVFQVVVEGPSASTELHNLTSSTEYLVSVTPVYEAGVGEGLRGLVTTGGWGSGLGSGPGAPLGAWHQPGQYVGRLQS